MTYHGLSALNTTLFPTWDSFFTTLLEQPDTVLKIKTPVSLGQRKYSEFDIDIEPGEKSMRFSFQFDVLTCLLTCIAFNRLINSKIMHAYIKCARADC